MTRKEWNTWLAGGAIALAGLYLFGRRSKTVTAFPDPAQAMVGTAGPPGTGSQPVLAGAGRYIFKRDPGGMGMCFTVDGARAPISKCTRLEESLALEGLGSLGHYGRGSLGA